MQNAVEATDSAAGNRHWRTHRPPTPQTPRRPGRLCSAVAALSLAGGILLAAGLPAQATPSAQPTQPDGQGRHCVAQAGTSTGDLRCYTTLPDAIAAATGGRVHLAPGTTGAQLRDVDLNQAAGSIYVLSVEWTGSNFTGASLTWEAPTACGDYGNNYMPRGWNDAIRSIAQYSGCATTLYWDVNFGGPTYSIDVNAQVSDLNWFDAQTSSQKWCPAFACT